MKIKALSLLATINGIVGPTIVIDPIKINYGLSYMSIDPFVFNNSSSINYTVNASSLNPVLVKVEVINDIYPDGIELFSNTFTEAGSYTFKYNNQYTRSKNEIRITYGGTKNNQLNIQTLPIERTSGKLVYIDEECESLSKSIYYDYDEGWNYYNEKLVFNNFNEYYVPNYYHKLDISEFSIRSIGREPSVLDNAGGVLTINNPNGYFDKIANNEDSFSINVKLVKKYGVYKLAFDEDLFVNKYSLEMSKSSAAGYIKTNYLYFPKNEMRSQDNYSLALLLPHLGANDNTYIHYFSFKALINTIGDCHNSEYCVVAKQ